MRTSYQHGSVTPDELNMLRFLFVSIATRVNRIHAAGPANALDHIKGIDEDARMGYSILVGHE